MALTLPYPTNSSLLQFEADTVHNYTTHNTPHQRLLLNDLAVKTAVDALQVDVIAAEADIVALQASPKGLRETYRTQLYASGNVFTAGELPSYWSFSVPASTYSSFYYLEVEVYAAPTPRNWKVGAFVGPTPFGMKGNSATKCTPLTPSYAPLNAATHTFIGAMHQDVDEDSRVHGNYGGKILYTGSWLTSSRTFYVEPANPTQMGWILVRVFGT